MGKSNVKSALTTRAFGVAALLFVSTGAFAGTTYYCTSNGDNKGRR